MSKSELEELRRKRGECITCGRKCFQKKLFKMIPITDHGRVLNGRCLNCKPLDAGENEGGLIPAVSRPATKEDLARFNRSQSNLGITTGPVVRSPGRSNSTGRQPSGRTFSDGNAAAAAAGSGGGSGSSTRNLAPGSAHARVPGRSQSGSASALASTVASPADSTWSRNRITGADLDTSSSRIDSSNRARSTTPSSRHLESSGSNSRRRNFDSSHDDGGHEFHDDYETQNDYSAGRRAVNEELSHEIAVMANERSQRLDARRSSHSSRAGVARHHSSDNAIGRDRGPRQGTLDRGGEIAFRNNHSQRSAATSNSMPTTNNSNHSPLHSSSNGGTGVGMLVDSARGNASITPMGSSNRSLSSTRSALDDELLNGFAAGYACSSYERGEQIESNTMRSRADSSHSRHGIGQAEEHAIDRIHDANGDCAEIMAIMRDWIHSPVVESFALKELSCLHLGIEEQDQLAHLGAMDIISEAMHSYADDIELQIHGCRAIWNASGTTENQLAFVNAGALEIILSSMDRFIDSAEVQECALGTLSNLAAAEPNLLHMVGKGTVGRVVESMNKHSDNNLVQSKGCSAITNMASHLSPLKKDIMDLGGGGAVVICMVMHPDDFDLQEKALRALKNLSSNNDENKIELANIGGIDAVITAMQVHRDQPGVQEAGAWTLSNLASNNENKAVIGDCGGIDVVIRAMWVHSDVTRVQEWCCRALYTLTLDRHNAGMVLQVGGISAIVNAMQGHVDSCPVQEMGCAVLCNLAFDESSKMRIVDEEALDAIVLAMVLYTDDGKVQESACEVLLALAIVENFKSMQASNIGELARAAATKFPENCQEPASKLVQVLEGFCEQY